MTSFSLPPVARRFYPPLTVPHKNRLLARFHTQHITGSPLAKPEDVVALQPLESKRSEQDHVASVGEDDNGRRAAIARVDHRVADVTFEHSPIGSLEALETLHFNAERGKH